ncbi:MAG: glycoside hydrolase family 1 protein [Myxococcales bacterium]|nr:glycoside hydrolase family 1 protein [Myxococcales bacterium]
MNRSFRARPGGLVGCLAVAVAIAGCTGGANHGSRPLAAKPFPRGFHFGAAMSAHQVEGGNHDTWTLFETLPQFAGRATEPSGAAVDHYHRYAEDFDWARWMGLDTVRISIEWSRIEPERGRYDAVEIAHYRDVLAAMRARGLRPSVTLHHFTDPTWLVDLTKLTPPVNADFCADGPSNTDQCFWRNPEAARAFGDYCALAAREFGPWVDEWWTVNELFGYWLTTSVTGTFPPLLTAFNDADRAAIALPVLRGLMDAHAACYRAIHAEDTVDADRDGIRARVGLTAGIGPIFPAVPDRPEDVGAAALSETVGNFLVLDAAATGAFDADFDGVADEDHPEWTGTLDLIGVQYYSSSTMIGIQLVPPLAGIPCLNIDFDLGEPDASAALTNLYVNLMLALGCPEAPTQDFPFGPEPPGRLYGRQSDPEGLLNSLVKVAARYPGTPLVVTENGFADDDEKRASSLVRHLVAVHDAIARGVPVEGYYHWSLLDNFEWLDGFRVRFGLLHVDYDQDLARSPTVAAEVYREITRAHGLLQRHLDERGGPGPLP